MKEVLSDSRVTHAKELCPSRYIELISSVNFGTAHPRVRTVMSLVLENCKIITGDGNTELRDANIIIKHGVIEDFGEDLRIGREFERFPRVDVQQHLVIPGVINHHEHAVTFGPNIMGDISLTESQVISHLDRHLSQGTTTICNVDGFITPEELRKTARRHPINLKTATMHNEHMIKAAEIISGCPHLTPVHRALTNRDLAQAGAVAIGEVEEMTIWGVLVYLPQILQKRTGAAVDPLKARALQQAILGDLESIPDFNPELIQELLGQTGLDHLITPIELKQLLEGIFLASHKVAHTAYKESAIEAEELGLPMIVHNALESSGWTIELAKEHSKRVHLIASHCDSITFKDASEALEKAIKLKKSGAIIDCTSYMPKHKELSEKGIELFKNDLVDVICTDALGGHDSILFFIEKLVENKLVKLPKAISMATYNVARAIPQLAPNRGLIARGKVADLAIVNPLHVSQVDKVILNGRIAVENGWRGGAWAPFGISSVLETWSS